MSLSISLSKRIAIQLLKDAVGNWEPFDKCTGLSWITGDELDEVGERDDGLLSGQVSDISEHKAVTNFGIFSVLSPELTAQIHINMYDTKS